MTEQKNIVRDIIQQFSTLNYLQDKQSPFIYFPKTPQTQLEFETEDRYILFNKKTKPSTSDLTRNHAVRLARPHSHRRDHHLHMHLSPRKDNEALNLIKQLTGWDVYHLVPKRIRVYAKEFFPKQWDANKGTRVILNVHGWQNSGAVFHDVAEKIQNDPNADPHYNIISVNLDLPGHGFSEKLKGFIHDNPIAYALILHLVVKRISEWYGVKQVTLVGHSMGGGLTRLYAELFLDEVEHFVPFNEWSTDQTPMSKMAAMGNGNAAKNIPSWLFSLAYGLYCAPKALRKYNQRPDIIDLNMIAWKQDEAIKEGAIKLLGHETTYDEVRNDTAKMQWHIIQRFDKNHPERAKALGKKTTFVIGKGDNLVPNRFQYQTAETLGIPKDAVVVLKGTRHLGPFGDEKIIKEAILKKN